MAASKSLRVLSLPREKTTACAALGESVDAVRWNVRLCCTGRGSDDCAEEEAVLRVRVDSDEVDEHDAGDAEQIQFRKDSCIMPNLCATTVIMESDISVRPNKLKNYNNLKILSGIR